ncbi:MULTISPECIES: alpha/beta hydrolase [Klebsiella]|uniref:alpha/beta hydrolase n=1 Tax=Klebsiella TaxID=570 RepID=UPI001D0D4668|nr:MULTISPECIES: alpha/beta hydrolase [Klebsiella]MCU8819163.1 alpha/beta hydrolase [Klebsiella quasipneumoniae]
MKLSKVFTLILCSSASLNCTSSDTVIAPYEKTLELDSSTSRSFHSMLYFPSGVLLHNPGYIVGIEKSPKEIIGGPKGIDDEYLIKNDTYVNGEIDGSNDTRHQINMFTKHNIKSMFISHIIKNDFNVIKGNSLSPYITNNYCFVYNAYISKYLADKSGRDLTKVNGWEACKFSSAIEDGKNAKLSSFYKNSDMGLAALKDNLKHDLKTGSYSHILIIVMGWNTSQSEAVRNFNDIAGNIITASLEQVKKNKVNHSAKPNTMVVPRSLAIGPRESQDNSIFRPLIIGITWPSYWSTGQLNVISYTDKANDADELGIIWLNKIINNIIPESLSESGVKLPVIAIGHSFGARAMTRALFSSPFIKNDKMVTSPVSLAVSLQGAMSINRFFPKLGIEGAPYRDYSKLTNTKIVLTASKFDSAVTIAKWTDPAGGYKSYEKACTQSVYSGAFHCMTASDTSSKIEHGIFKLCNLGETSDECADPLNSSISPRVVDYIDTSNGITEYNSLGTGGGAHSDIYRLPMGRLLWRLIQAYAIEERK